MKLRWYLLVLLIAVFPATSFGQNVLDRLLGASTVLSQQDFAVEMHKRLSAQDHVVSVSHSDPKGDSLEVLFAKKEDVMVWNLANAYLLYSESENSDEDRAEILDYWETKAIILSMKGEKS